MKTELFSFQSRAVENLRTCIRAAASAWRDAKIPQVVSLQAPTGTGKTIIMAALMENIFYGTADYPEQPEAIFVWLSDSPALNEQSRHKLERVANRIRVSQCVTIEDASFDQEVLEDGHVYFLNTQKLGSKGNLSRPSDRRQYTIWQTLENTAKRKSDHLYFIIDEAHRGMQGKDARQATSIMQRFLIGYSLDGEQLLSPMPLVIGISATPERFNALVGKIQSGRYPVIIRPDDVRSSGLLKDRIIITYPDDSSRHDGWTVLRAATNEWLNKCSQWQSFCQSQHIDPINPIFVIQVQGGSDSVTSATDLDTLLAHIDEIISPHHLREYEVVHTFGSVTTLHINGLPVHHIDPSDIADNTRIRLVFFKENLSTGWDCPRAETMLSFCHRQDATYIAQLLGRMVRTPLQQRILSDDSLNEVRLFLPGFDRSTVKLVIDKLQHSDEGEIASNIEDEELNSGTYTPLSPNPKPRHHQPNPEQGSLFPYPNKNEPNTLPLHEPETSNYDAPQCPAPTTPSASASPANPSTASSLPLTSLQSPSLAQSDLSLYPNSADVVRFINDQHFITFKVTNSRINNYLTSLLNLSSLLITYGFYPNARFEISEEVIRRIREYVTSLHDENIYDKKAKEQLHIKLLTETINTFGKILQSHPELSLFPASESELDRRLEEANRSLGSAGFHIDYGSRFFDQNNPHAFKIDVILFASNDSCISDLLEYAKNQFHKWSDDFRLCFANQPESVYREYENIIADGDAVSKHHLRLPENLCIKQDPTADAYLNHLFADQLGIVRLKFNKWEKDLITEESRRPDFVYWLRNVHRAEGSLCFPFSVGNEKKVAYPDFIIIRRNPVPTSDRPYVLDILEPHGIYLDDNLAKAKGLAEYAKIEPRFGRIQLIREATDSITGKPYLRRLDFTRSKVREEVLNAYDNNDLKRIFDTYSFSDSPTAPRCNTEIDRS